MINVIIYSENDNYLKKHIKVVNVALAKYNVDYRIYTFSDYDEDFETIVKTDLIKIYIIDVFSGGKGIDVALRIRKNELNSIIILIADCNKYQDAIFLDRLLVLDFICLNNDYEVRLCDDILYALKIIYERKSFVFKYNHIVYRIPYSQIDYIEKESEIKRCIIHTLNGNYYVVNSIQRLKDIFGFNFFRVHQSCIINIKNVKKIDLVNNIIYFNDDEFTMLFSNKYKRELMVLLDLK